MLFCSNALKVKYCIGKKAIRRYFIFEVLCCNLNQKIRFFIFNK
jgi:hypothetical protein